MGGGKKYPSQGSIISKVKGNRWLPWGSRKPGRGKLARSQGPTERALQLRSRPACALRVPFKGRGLAVARSPKLPCARAGSSATSLATSRPLSPSSPLPLRGRRRRCLSCRAWGRRADRRRRHEHLPADRGPVPPGGHRHPAAENLEDALLRR